MEHKSNWDGGMKPVQILLVCRGVGHLTDQGWRVPPWVNSLHKKVLACYAKKNRREQ